MRIPADPRFRSGPPAVAPTEHPEPPPELADRLAGAAWEQIWVRPEAEVWRIRPADGSTAYVKVLDDLAEWAGEVERLRWVLGRSSVATPALLGAGSGDDGRGWILTAEVAGTPSHDPGLAIPDAAPLIDAMGFGMRAFHDSLPVADCPFSHRVDDLLASAVARVARGGVDPSSMASPTYQRLSAERLLEHLVASRPPEPESDLVVAHGDPCQPNLLIDPTAPAGERLVGLVDVGRVGVSDRYRDLAIAVRSLTMNFDGEAAARFLDAYGVPHPDPLRLEWYVLADDMW